MSVKKKTSVAVLCACGVVMATMPVLAKGGHQNRIQFEQMDTNADGKITTQEMAAVAQARFEQTDTDGDGLLSVEELTARATADHQERLARRVARMIETRDTDADGQLSAEEMMPSQDRLAKRFERMDRNDDGALSEDEFTKAGKRGGHQRRSR